MRTGGGSSPTGGQVTASKEITHTEVDETTGKPTYTIKLSVNGTPYTKTTETPGKANVVLVIDKSGSMKERISTGWFQWTTRMNVAKTAASGFIDQILPEGSNNQLAVVAFDGHSGGTNDRGVNSTSLKSSADKASLKEFVNSLKAEGGTNYTAALSKAQEILNDSKVPSYIVFISDGNPGQSGKSYDDLNWNGSNQAASLKKAGTTIFSVGIGDQIDDNAKTALTNIASVDAEGTSHFTAISDSNLAEGLPNILEGLANEINTQTVSAGNDAVLTDGINTEKFNLVSESLPDGVSEENGTLTWNIGSIPPAETSVTFKVTPNNDAYGRDCYTNTGVGLTYNDGLTGESKTDKDFGNPKVSLYKVVYLKDDESELVHYGGLASLDGHPEPEENPTKTTNYTFKGWDEGTLSEDGYVKTFRPIFVEKDTPTPPTEKYTVTYTDGVADGEVFKDQVASNILTGTYTPAFDGSLDRDGYVFSGWKNEATGNVVKDPTQLKVTSDVTYVAQWKDDKNSNGKPDDTEAHYTVTYTDGVADEEVFKDQVASNILTGTKTPAFSGTPTRSGYTFADWTPTVEETVTKNITYTATWTKNNTPTNPTTPTTPSTPSTPSEEHKVTITPNNGDPDITQTVPDGGKAVEPDDLTNDGYELDGWYTDSSLTKPFDFNQPIKSDVHIYAKWTKTNETVNPITPVKKKVTGILLPKVIAKGKHTQTLTWTALKNVDGYFIYTNHCDEAQGRIPHPFKKVADYKASKARVYTKKNLKTYHNYKYYVAAYKIKNGKKVVVRNSVTVHSVCGNTSARSTNVKSVKASKHSVTLKKGKTYKIKATLSKVNKKRAFLDATHCGLLRYLTADSSIATVNYKTGVIKAKKAGKTTVYVLGVNGVRDKVTVAVK